MSAHARGQFVWHELMTTDSKAAIEFYTKVTGWKTEAWGGEGGDGNYRMWVGSQGPVGGVMNLPAEARQAGVPPHWISNVTVDDVDATVARVRELGGQVLSPANDMPGVGRFAVIADPQGANIAIFKPENPMTPSDMDKPGGFGWSELYTSDLEAGFKFYQEIFGWDKVGAMDMGPEMGEYLLFGQGEKQLGGMMKRPPNIPSSVWNYYIHVADLDAALDRARRNEAQLLNGPMEVPGGLRVANLVDPQGAFFSLLGK